MEEVRQQLKHFEELASKQQAEQEAQANAEKEQLRLKQIDDGRCKVVPHPKVATQPFRSELTIEQNSLFVANRFKGEFFVREQTVLHPESQEPIVRRVTVGRTSEEGKPRGVLKQVHQDVFYRLLQLWAEHGYGVARKDDEVYGSFSMSAYRIVMALRGSHNAHEYRRVKDLLQDLCSIPVVLENAYTWQGLEDCLQFTLLNGVSWKDRGVDKKTKLPKQDKVSKVTVLFSEMVTESFLHAHVKTLLGEPYRELGAQKRGGRGELPRLLYPFLDAQLATKDSYHTKLTTLAERFGLSVHAHKSLRKRQFSAAVRLLDGKLIQGKRHRLRVQLRESSEGDDYVLVARREASNQLPLFKD